MRAEIRSLYLRVASLLKKPKNGIHILNGHFGSGVHVRESRNFDNFIDIISDFGVLTDFNIAAEMISANKVDVDKPYIALSFDDGFRECFDEIYISLKKRSVVGGFFINSEVISIPPHLLNEYRSRVQTFNKNFLDWEMLKQMAQDGQIIGSHTYGHYRLSELSESEFKREIISNKEFIAEHLEINTDYFAWPYGRLCDVTASQIDFIKKQHKYIFSGDNFKNYTSFDGRVINRRHIESHWPRSHIKYFISHGKK